MSINRGRDKKDMERIYNEILLSHKRNEIISFPATWMDLDVTILSEVSQAEKDNYMISLICAAQKIVEINLFPKQKQTHRLRK